MTKLSVIIPVYNEINSIEEIICLVQAVDIPKEIIVVDDYSNDGTRELLKGISKETGRYSCQYVEGEFPVANIRILYQPKNQGKGSALKVGFANAKGEIVIIQDADLEYDPAQYPEIIKPIEDNIAEVVYGSRFLETTSSNTNSFWHSVGNKLLTNFSNWCSHLNLTDMETCYKAFRREVIQKIDLQEKRFGVEPEITAKLARMGVRIKEVGISYSRRTYGEGKKIGVKDGFRALWVIVKYNKLTK